MLYRERGSAVRASPPETCARGLHVAHPGMTRFPRHGKIVDFARRQQTYRRLRCGALATFEHQRHPQKAVMTWRSFSEHQQPEEEAGLRCFLLPSLQVSPE